MILGRFTITLLLLIIGLNSAVAQEYKNNLRAPAYPLVTIDPYTSVWSFTDNLNEDAVRHWTGVPNGMIGAIRVDGEVYRFMGIENFEPVPVLPDARGKAWDCKYSLTKPENGWQEPGYKCDSWQDGKGAFGTPGQPNLATVWESKNIWVRRAFELSADDLNEKLTLIYSHDDDFTLYLNGEKIIDTGYAWRNNVSLVLDGKLKELLKTGENIIAIHCENRVGGGLVDVGIFKDNTEKPVFDNKAIQKDVNVLPTRTIYSFACGPVDLELTFTAPLLPENLDLISRPVNYIDYKVFANDNKNHEVEIYFETTPEWAIDQVAQPVVFDQYEKNGLSFLKTGTKAQPVLQKKGDNVRIDWGYHYLVSQKSKDFSGMIDEMNNCKLVFKNYGELTGKKINKKVVSFYENKTVLAVAQSLGKVSKKAAQGYIMLGYDDVESIQYFGTNLKAWWRYNSDTPTIEKAFAEAADAHSSLLEKCVSFDKSMMEDAVASGGKEYADLCALAYRQSVAAHKLVKDPQGNILFLSKENFSNGSIGTVDVTYPSAPLYLYYNPDLLKGMLNPIFYYSESGKWEKPFPAHDVGTYPLANGQTYGEDMPVEEAGNMMILTTAICAVENDYSYASEHWEVLTTWVNYLMEKGLDPDNQLCTDDFAGHLAHNANLSVKAIMGIAGYGMMAKELGHVETGEKYIKAARDMAGQWEKMANDGDHYALTFDKKGTWSQKYNLVWDEMLGTGIFPLSISQTEIAYYLTKQEKFGLPLDSRRTYTKSDWVMWTATLADDKETFETFIAPMYRAFHETEKRVPMTDWYETTNADQVGFQARSVVGGYFIKMLKDKMLMKSNN